jgi:hypothetical protein
VKLYGRLPETRGLIACMQSDVCSKFDVDVSYNPVFKELRDATCLAIGHTAN